MFIFNSAFWVSKSESLAQDLVSSFIKTVLIALVAFVVMEYAKNLLEVYDKRRALVAFQNGIITTAISKLQDGYNAQFGCLASVPQFKKEDCANGLRSFRVALDVQEDLVSGIVGTGEAATRTLAVSIDELLAAQGSTLTSEDLEKLSQSAKANLRSAIDGLAQEIR
ncbi:hypothetical protein [Rhizobium leguminosarum]|uniref:hypothetical protein n=1 Tax=Rhizobium leguminosarum TaxID=384 RepID=UPI0004874D5D|nr:hypothetical protein [Rhizobium leguminosarum]